MPARDGVNPARTTMSVFTKNRASPPAAEKMPAVAGEDCAKVSSIQPSVFLLPPDLFTTLAHQPAPPTRAVSELYGHLAQMRAGSEQDLEDMLLHLVSRAVCAMPTEQGHVDTTRSDLLYHACTAVLYHLKSVMHELSEPQKQHVAQELETACGMGASRHASCGSPMLPWKTGQPSTFAMPTLTESDEDTSFVVYTKEGGGTAVLAPDAGRLGALSSDSDGVLSHFGPLLGVRVAYA
jgi:hypothetical protein